MERRDETDETALEGDVDTRMTCAMIVWGLCPFLVRMFIHLLFIYIYIYTYASMEPVGEI